MSSGIICLSAIFLLALSLGLPAAAIEVSLSDDAFHYVHNGIDDQLYNEWWYFNGISSDAQFIFCYLISDPENITGLRKIQVLAMLMDDPAVVAVHQSKGYGGDRNNPSFDIDQSSITALNASTYRIFGSARDLLSGQPVDWDLTYRAIFNPWFATPVQINIGNTDGGWMKWLVYMPSARVTGTITANNQTRKINATGYHDHNWGRWVYNDPQWNWAWVSKPEDGFGLSLGETIGSDKLTLLGLNYAGKSVKFSGDQVNLTYSDYLLDPITASTYPGIYKVRAKNNDYLLEMIITVQKNVPFLFDYPKPLPSFLIFEQLSRFKGTLKSKGASDYSFDQLGFSRYSTHRLHPIYGKINVSGPKNVTVTARNERTGQIKTASTGSSAWFGFDADYADYLANRSSPWVSGGDKVSLVVQYNNNEIMNTSMITIDIKQDRQEVNLSSYL